MDAVTEILVFVLAALIGFEVDLERAVPRPPAALELCFRGARIREAAGSTLGDFEATLAAAEGDEIARMTVRAQVTDPDTYRQQREQARV